MILPRPPRWALGPISAALVPPADPLPEPAGPQVRGAVKGSTWRGPQARPRVPCVPGHGWRGGPGATVPDSGPRSANLQCRRCRPRTDARSMRQPPAGLGPRRGRGRWEALPPTTSRPSARRHAAFFRVASPTSRARPGTQRPGCWPATGGPRRRVRPGRPRARPRPGSAAARLTS